ncbi:uncharacterized protein LOC134838302 [Culicoides brevitarsis]|uniref:uncharacterized protein LOC134838302 n=1 Tax=Culicoides brevitarsis TaxID=469753 RepID=UPI00307BBEC6
MRPLVTLKPDYEIALRSKLPAVTSKMLQNYFLRAENFEDAADEAFDDRNVGYVQLQRKTEKCSIFGKIVTLVDGIPDYFPQEVLVDEKKQEIETVSCFMCKKDACSHALAFLFWLHRHSQPMKMAEDACYWMESLVEYELTLYIVPVKQIFQLPVEKSGVTGDVDAFLKDITQLIKDKDIKCPLGRYLCKKKKYNFTSMHELILDATRNTHSWEQFLKAASDALTLDARRTIRENTKYRYNDPTLYLEMRYGRISSAKVFDCMSKQVPFEKLYEKIMGFHKEEDTIEQNRKRRIELNVRQQLEFFAKVQYENPGLFLDPEFPLICVIPDGICENHIVEIKCPATEEEMSRFMSGGEQLSPKYYTEMQVQMYVTGKEASVVCVADPQFEENKNIYIQTVALDREYARNAMQKAQEYWRNFIFPYELTKWCVERDGASKGALPPLEMLKHLDPKREKDDEISVSETEITEVVINGVPTVVVDESLNKPNGVSGDEKMEIDENKKTNEEILVENKQKLAENDKNSNKEEESLKKNDETSEILMETEENLNKNEEKLTEIDANPKENDQTVTEID